MAKSLTSRTLVVHHQMSEAVWLRLLENWWGARCRLYAVVVIGKAVPSGRTGKCCTQVDIDCHTAAEDHL